MLKLAFQPRSRGAPGKQGLVDFINGHGGPYILFAHLKDYLHWSQGVHVVVVDMSTIVMPLISDLITKQYSSDIYDFKFINAAAWFIPIKVFYNVGGFDPIFFMYGEDDNYSQRVQFHGFKIGVIPNAMIFHDSPNNNYQLGKFGSEKYYQQFLNNVYIKYANINKDHYKKINKFKFYLLRKLIFKASLFKVDCVVVYFKKYRLVKVSLILNSIYRNKNVNPSYLDIK